MTRQNPPRDERTTLREAKDIRRRLLALETAPRVGPWVPITLNAGYSASLDGGLGFGYRPAYRFLSRLTVQLRGNIQKGTGAGGVGANGFALNDSPFTLPAELWPVQFVPLPTTCSAGGAANSYGTIRCQVSQAGVFTYASNIANAPGWIDLAGWEYDIE